MADALDETLPEMQTERITLPDGRQLIYYSFDFSGDRTDDEE